MNFNLIGAMIFSISFSFSAMANPVTLYCDPSPSNDVETQPIVLTLDLENREFSLGGAKIHGDHFLFSPMTIEVVDIHSVSYVINRQTLDFTIENPPEYMTLSGPGPREREDFTCAKEIETKI